MRSWPFFPRFHALYATCPNVNPIAVTTGVGPNGPSTQWIQRPDYFIDPILLADDRTGASALPVFVEGPSAPLTPLRPFGTDSTNYYEAGTPPPPNTATPLPTPSASCTPKPSTGSRQAIEKMKANLRIASNSKKRAFMDEILDVTK